MNLYPTVRRGILGLLELFIGYIDIDGLYLHIKLQSGVYTVHITTQSLLTLGTENQNILILEWQL